MAVLNVRVEDEVRDQLRALADEKGSTLSEFVRELLMETVVPVSSRDRESRHGEERASESMPIFERQTLAMLHRILGRVLPPGSNDVDGDRDYQLMRARILEEGFTGEYGFETAGFSTELSKRDCRRVLDILQMFQMISYSRSHLARPGSPGRDPAFEFRGFDHNDPLESHMARYVQHVMDDDHSWLELRPQLHDGGNSHMPMLATYLRMLSEYRRIMDGRGYGHTPESYLLTQAELQQITEARVHPSRRP